MQSVWAQLMFNGSLTPEAAGGWRSVEQVAGFPAHYGVQRISSADLTPFDPLMFVTDYKADVCTMLAGFGFDQRFWWVD